MSAIKAFLFDLDGTLVQTERLKALSYAKAAVQLAPSIMTEEAVVEAFKEVVGRSRYEVAGYLLQKFSLEDAAAKKIATTETESAIDAFIKIRLGFYHRMIDDPLIIQKSMWPHNIAQLYNAISDGFLTGLATMSHRQQVTRVLDVLSIQDCFDFIATRDDVERGKPDPEIYNLVISNLKVRPKECLVFEDSVSGVTAALAAGMHVIAVSTPFTRTSLEQADLLPREQLVHNPQDLQGVIDHMLSEQGSQLAA